MKGWQKLICRASVVAGISFFSLLIYYGFPPQMEALYIAGLNFGLSFLFFINTAFENNDSDGDGKSDEKKDEQIIVQTKGRKKRMRKLLGAIPNFWFP